MTPDEQALIAKIERDPAFQELVRTRARFAVLLSAIMLIIYFGFILVIAFQPALLARPIAGGVTTVGIPVGLFVIVSAFVLTAIYVKRANGQFDRLTAEIVARAR